MLADLPRGVWRGSVRQSLVHCSPGNPSRLFAFKQGGLLRGSSGRKSLSKLTRSSPVSRAFCFENALGFGFQDVLDQVAGELWEVDLVDQSVEAAEAFAQVATPGPLRAVRRGRR